MGIKVFHILGYLASRYGGPPKFAINLGKALDKYGVDSYWWATANEKERKELAYLGDKAFLFRSRFPHSWYRSPELARELGKKIDESDILHLHQVWDYPLWIAARLAYKKKKPYIITTHGILGQSRRYEGIKKRIYLKLIARFVLNHASAVHAIHEQEINGYKKLEINSPLIIIPNGIDPKKFQTAQDSEEAEKIWPLLKGKKVVLFLGRLSPEKGIDVLLQSWRYVTRERPDAMLVLAGPDYKGYANKTRRMVHKYGLGSKVIFSDFIRGDIKKAMLGRATLLVLPSYYEGFSTVVLEALAAGIPCVITTGCNFPEIQEVGAGYVIPTGDKDALYHSLLRMLALSELQLKEMGQSGKKLVMREYTIDLIAAKMMLVYRCILAHQAIPLYPEAETLL